MKERKWRREWDSNPRHIAVSLVFKTSSLNRSDISPNASLQSRELSYHIRSRFVNSFWQKLVNISGRNLDVPVGKCYTNCNENNAYWKVFLYDKN